MYIIYESSGMGGRIRSYILRAGEPSKIAWNLLYEDSLLCLLQQGRHMGTKGDQKQLDKIARLYDAYQVDEVDSKMMETFGFKISTGEHKCIAFAESEQEIEAMCVKLEALYDKKDIKGTPAGMRFLEILESIRAEGADPSGNLISRINGIQFIV